MTVAYRSSSTITTYGSRTNTTLTAPAGIQNGDILVIWFILGGSGTPTATPPANFNVATGYPHNVTLAGFTVSCYIWWKLASGESGNYVVTHAANYSQGWIGAYSGADGSTPLAPAPTYASGSGATSTATGLTTTRDGSAVIFAAHDWGDTSNDLNVPTGTTPTFAERTTGAIAISYIADGVLSTAGATGNKAITNNNGGAYPWQAALIALQPPAGGDQTPTIADVSTAADYLSVDKGTILGETPAWSLVQSVAPASVASGATSAAAFPANVTAGNRILVYTARISNATDVNTPTDTQGNIYTRIVQNSSTICLSIWTAVAETTGANTITVTTSAGSQYGWTAQEYAGLDNSAGTGCLDVSANGTNANVTTQPTTGTTPATHADGQLAVVTACDWGDLITGLPPAGYTKTSAASRDNDANADQVVAVKTSAGGATEGGTFSGFAGTASLRAASVAVIKRAAAGTPPLDYASSTISAAAASATATPVAYPANIAADDLLVLFVGTKPYSATIGTPAGWTPQGTTTNGTTAAGTDTGSTKIAAFTKVADGTETGNLTVSVTNGDSTWASISRIVKDPAKNWDIANTTGTMAAATNFTSTLAANPGITVDDLIVVAAANSTDLACTWSAQTLTANGANFSAPLDPAGIQNPRITTGNDSGGNIQWFRCWAGTATTAPVWAGTHSVSTNQAASTALIRIRQQSPATQAVDLADSGSATSTIETAVAGLQINITDSGAATTNLSHTETISYYGTGYAAGGYLGPLATAASLTDSGTATTNIVVSAAIPRSDAATASETLTRTGQTPVTLPADNATGADTQTISAAIASADTATAADAISSTASIAFAASAVATTISTVAQQESPSLADEAAAADNINSSAQLSTATAAAASETLTVTISSAPGIDSGTATDNITVVLAQRDIAFSDDTSAADTLTKQVTLAPGLDSAAAAETISVNKNLLLQDTASSTQTISRQRDDSGTATDKLTTSAAIRLVDTATAGSVLRGITTPKQLVDLAAAITAMTATHPTPPAARNATHATTIPDPGILDIVSGAPTSLLVTTSPDGRVTITSKPGKVAVEYR